MNIRRACLVFGAVLLLCRVRARENVPLQKKNSPQQVAGGGSKKKTFTVSDQHTSGSYSFSDYGLRDDAPVAPDPKAPQGMSLHDLAEAPNRNDVAVGMVVKRGPDWRYGNQDGGVGSFGVVVEIRQWFVDRKLNEARRRRDNGELSDQMKSAPDPKGAANGPNRNPKGKPANARRCQHGSGSPIRRGGARVYPLNWTLVKIRRSLS